MSDGPGPEPLKGPLRTFLFAFSIGVTLYAAATAALLQVAGTGWPLLLYAAVAAFGAVVLVQLARRHPLAPGLVFFLGLAFAAVGALSVALDGGLIAVFEALMGLSTALAGAGAVLTRRGASGPSRAERRRRERKR